VNSFAETIDWTPVVQTALENLDATNLDEDWYFTMEVIEEGELRVIHNDPRRAKYDKRQLVTVNGVAPSDQRQKEFRDTEVKRIDDIDPDTSDYEYLVDISTLQLIDASSGYTGFSFLPRVKALEESRDQLRGSLVLNTGTQQIEAIEINNAGELSPAFSVSVDTYRLELSFRSEHGEIVLQKLESHAVGTVGFLKHFDALVVVVFSDFTRADL
jgi:hypothetical protein